MVMLNCVERFVERRDIANASAERVAEALRCIDMAPGRADLDQELVTTESSRAIPEAPRRRVDIFVDY